MSFWGVQFYDILSATIETTTRYRSERLKICQPQKLLALPSFFHRSFSFSTSDNSNSNLPNLHSIITTWCQGTRTDSAARFGEPSSWKYWRNWVVDIIWVKLWTGVNWKSSYPYLKNKGRCRFLKRCSPSLKLLLQFSILPKTILAMQLMDKIFQLIWWSFPTTHFYLHHLRTGAQRRILSINQAELSTAQLHYFMLREAAQKFQLWFSLFAPLNFLIQTSVYSCLLLPDLLGMMRPGFSR